MRERIQKLIEAEGLTSSKFADMIGIQRSSVSHFLNGRNNPSLEVILKILTAFSKLNSDWLLFGKGSMFKEEAKNISNEYQQQQAELFVAENQEVMKDSLISVTTNEREAPPKTTRLIKPESESLKSITDSNSDKEEKPETQVITEKAQNSTKKKKKKKKSKKQLRASKNQNNNPKQGANTAERIIIFNNDRTFIEYTAK